MKTRGKMKSSEFKMRSELVKEKIINCKESIKPVANKKKEGDQKNEWIPLPLNSKPKTSFYAKDRFGVDKLLFRIENGNAVIYIDEYIPSELIQAAIAEVKIWGSMLFDKV